MSSDTIYLKRVETFEWERGLHFTQHFPARELTEHKWKIFKIAEAGCSKWTLDSVASVQPLILGMIHITQNDGHHARQYRTKRGKLLAVFFATPERLFTFQHHAQLRSPSMQQLPATILFPGTIKLKVLSEMPVIECGWFWMHGV